MMNKEEQPEFWIANDPAHDFDLKCEAWIDDEHIASMRPTDNGWMVVFYSKQEKCELPWEIFIKISHQFTDFFKEMENSQLTKPEKG